MTTASLLEYQQATADAQTTVAKGEALVTFLTQVFIQLDGVSVTESNVFSDDHSQEVDVVLWNEKREGVTGNHRDARFAAAVILRARAEKVRIVVATPQELALEAADLRAFLQERLSNLACGRAGLPT